MRALKGNTTEDPPLVKNKYVFSGGDHPINSPELFTVAFPISRIEKTIDQDALNALKQLIDSESDISSSFKTRQPKLIMKQSNITKTGQVPSYYVYYDSKGNPKTRPVEPEEYDRYVMENKR